MRFPIAMMLAMLMPMAAQAQHADPGPPDAKQIAAMAKAYASIRPTLREKLSIQLYSVRDDLKRDLDGTLARLKAIGFTHVETYGGITARPEETRAALDRAGLKANSSHVSMKTMQEAPQDIVAYARTMGVDRVGLAWVKTTSDDVLFDEAQAREVAAVFNQACPVLKAAGLKPFIHPHGFEFIRHGDGTLLDLIVSLVPPECMEVQVDIFWAKHGGADPAALIGKLKPRSTQLHLKDMDRSVVTPQTNGRAPDETSVALGTGQIDIPGVLAAARAADSDWIVIEDESPDIWRQLHQTLEFLSKQ